MLTRSYGEEPFDAAWSARTLGHRTLTVAENVAIRCGVAGTRQNLPLVPMPDNMKGGGLDIDLDQVRAWSDRLFSHLQISLGHRIDATG